MAFSPQFLDEIRARVDLGEVVGRHVKLARRGREFVGLSPFQNEKSPSFTVVPEKGFYHCFSSGEHGDVIDFVMKVEGLSFPDAVERLAGLAGVPIPADTPEEQARNKKRQSLYGVIEAATRYFERCLHMPEGKAAATYLRGRGLDDETIARFRLGYAPNSRTAIKGALGREGIDEAALIEAGLLIEIEDTARKPYDRFRGRIMFPITDRRGRAIAFGGRIVADGEPKYLNSPETPLFHKGSVLYGLNQASRAARNANSVIVTEGYMDVIALNRAGIENAVAPLGTALTEEQFALLWRLATEAVLCFDGDRAGQQAAARAAERALPLLKPEFGLRFALLPPGEDPDSLVTSQGREAMTRVLAAAVPLSEALWSIESGGRVPATPEARAALQQRLDKHTANITDTTVRSHFRRGFRERLWPSRSSHNSRRPNTGFISMDSNQAMAPKVDMGRVREQILLATLINHPQLFDDIGERLGLLSFLVPDLDNLRQEVLKTLAEEEGLDREALELRLRLSGFAEAVVSVTSPQIFEHAFFARPGTPAATARIGWEETYGRYTDKGLLDDIEEAKRRLAEDMTEEAFDRMRMLLVQRQQQEEASAADQYEDTPSGGAG